MVPPTRRSEGRRPRPRARHPHECLDSTRKPASQPEVACSRNAPLLPQGFFVAMTRISRESKIPYPHSPSTSASNVPPPHPVLTCLAHIRSQRFRAPSKRHSVKCIRWDEMCTWGTYPRGSLVPHAYILRIWRGGSGILDGRLMVQARNDLLDDANNGGPWGAMPLPVCHFLARISSKV